MRRVGPWPLGRAKNAVARPLASETVRLNDIDDSPSLATIPCQVFSSSDDGSSDTKEAIPAVVPNWETLRSTTHGILKEAVHMKTGKYYACKVINKKLSEGREFMVRLQSTYPLFGYKSLILM